MTYNSNPCSDLLMSARDGSNVGHVTDRRQHVTDHFRKYEPNESSPVYVVQRPRGSNVNIGWHQASKDQLKKELFSDFQSVSMAIMGT